MKYMMLVKLNRNSKEGMNYEAGTPPDSKLGIAMQDLVEELTKSGAMVGTGGLLPLANGAQIKARGGRLTVTDGPFIESKEVTGGYAILRAKSKKEAVKMGEDFMKLHLDILGPSYEGELEIRQMFDPADHECGAKEG